MGQSIAESDTVLQDIDDSKSSEIEINEVVTKDTDNGLFQSITDDAVLPAMLYEGSQLTPEASNLLIRSYSARYHLTNKAEDDLLKLLKLHLPQDKNHALPSSRYIFRKVASKGPGSELEPTQHYYCNHCYTFLPDQSSCLCPNQLCGTLISEAPYFITISIEEQIDVIFKSKQ